jgi:hypothetical protein
MANDVAETGMPNYDEVITKITAIVTDGSPERELP